MAQCGGGFFFSRWRSSVFYANIGSLFWFQKTVNCSACSCFESSYWGFAICAVLFGPRLQSCAKFLGNCNLQGLPLRQASVELQFAICGLAQSLWGITISRLLSCVKLLGNSNLQGYWGIAICMVRFCSSYFLSAKLFLHAGSSYILRFIIYLQHTPSSRSSVNMFLMRRFRFIIYLKHAPVPPVGRDRFISLSLHHTS